MKKTRKKLTLADKVAPVTESVQGLIADRPFHDYHPDGNLPSGPEIGRFLRLPG